MVPQFETMNETDVREVIVRPLLARLGYAHGTKANIRTEVTLRYDRAFLGRKNTRKDPPLAGRADYVCEAVTFGRWTVEVKGPNEQLTQDDVEQAHSYSAHPEIAATHFLLTNGREFRLYVTGDLAAPLLSWSWDQIDEVLPAVHNVLSYEAVVRRSTRLRYDMAKPIGRGLASKVEVIAGEIHLGRFSASYPQFDANALEGSIASVTSGSIFRDQDGRLSLEVGYRSPMQQLTKLIEAAGLDRYQFSSTEEFLSDDEATPTIFQNFTSGSAAPGLQFQVGMGLQAITLPVGFDYSMYANAVVHFDGSREVKGTLDLAYDYNIKQTAASRLHPGFAALPDMISVQGQAEVFIVLAV